MHIYDIPDIYVFVSHFCKSMFLVFYVKNGQNLQNLQKWSAAWAATNRELLSICLSNGAVRDHRMALIVEVDILNLVVAGVSHCQKERRSRKQERKSPYTTEPAAMNTRFMKVKVWGFSPTQSFSSAYSPSLECFSGAQVQTQGRLHIVKHASHFDQV